MAAEALELQQGAQAARGATAMSDNEKGLRGAQRAWPGRREVGRLSQTRCMR